MTGHREHPPPGRAPPPRGGSARRYRRARARGPMTGNREHPPPASAPAAPEARALAATGPGRVVGLDGIRGLAALYVVVYHIFLRAWPGYPGAIHAPFWAVGFSYGRGAVAMF